MITRRKRKEATPLKKGLWLVTFSDLSTLLLALFVMLFSMSSIDSGLVERISSSLRDSFPYSSPGKGRADSRLEIVLKLLEDARQIRENEELIKELLFPDDLLPPDLDAGILRKEVRILAGPEGAHIVFSEDLLFAESSSTLQPGARALLQSLVPVLLLSDRDILISGHSDAPAPDPAARPENAEGGATAGGGADDAARAVANLRYRYQLSADRALAVLGYFSRAGVEQRRFSVAGYGADRPLVLARPAAQEDGALPDGGANGGAGAATGAPQAGEAPPQGSNAAQAGAPANAVGPAGASQAGARRPDADPLAGTSLGPVAGAQAGGAMLLPDRGEAVGNNRRVEIVLKNRGGGFYR
ncbi:OmpA family protein [Desulfovibrio sp. OttesenSCG-928-C14]|nr:OmpA family protein [Desulfovibrio sp. OttesenSCG-928-C14]